MKQNFSVKTTLSPNETKVLFSIMRAANFAKTVAIFYCVNTVQELTTLNVLIHLSERFRMMLGLVHFALQSHFLAKFKGF